MFSLPSQSDLSREVNVMGLSTGEDVQVPARMKKLSCGLCIHV